MNRRGRRERRGFSHEKKVFFSAPSALSAVRQFSAEQKDFFSASSAVRFAFTLTEILIAIGILGIGLVLILAAFPVAAIQHQQTVEHGEGLVTISSARSLVGVADTAPNDIRSTAADTTFPTVYAGDLVVGNPLTPPPARVQGVWNALPVAPRGGDNGDGGQFIAAYLSALPAVPPGPFLPAQVNRDAFFNPTNNVFRDLNTTLTGPGWQFHKLPFVREDLADAYFGRQNVPRCVCWPFVYDDPAAAVPTFTYRVVVVRFGLDVRYPAIGAILAVPGLPIVVNNGVAFPSPYPAGLFPHPIPWRVALTGIAPDRTQVTLSHASISYGVFGNFVQGELLQEKMIFFGAATGKYYRILTRVAANQFQIQPTFDVLDQNAGVWLFPPAVELTGIGPGTTMVFTTRRPYITAQ